MHNRSEQLSLPHIPVQSFEWIWESAFSSWLSSSDPFFWISGKPGSGKSTLMQYLVDSSRTFRNLNKPSRQYVIVKFFFDYRAGSATANNPTGILKMFLSQLCAFSLDLERKLAVQNAEASIATAGFTKLLDLLVEAIRLLGSELCAFVDGLDEYNGHYTDLGNILARIQDRTGMRLCVASRPVSAFQDLFEGRSSLRLQDHNAASVRAYIDHAIRKGHEHMAQVDTVFDLSMRDQLQQRAQGVIIWARLAVDELLRAAYVDTPREVLQEILEQLPEELEDMYERIISQAQVRHSNTAEVALILFLLNGFGGSIGTGMLFGLWHFFCSHVPGCSMPSDSIDQEAFLERLIVLIGSLVDVLTKSLEVRLMHKTLQPYLRQSILIRDHLPEVFRGRYAKHFEIQVYADVIEAATNDRAATLDDILGALHGSLTPLQCLGVAICGQFENIPDHLHAWRTRIELLTGSVSGFLVQAQILEKGGISSYEIGHRILSSHFLIAGVRSPLPKYRSWHRAKQGGFVDFVIALESGLKLYAENRLARRLLLNEQDWAELFYITLARDGPDEGLLNLLRPHCKLILPKSLLACLNFWRRGRRPSNNYLAWLISDMKLPPIVSNDASLCENQSCGEEDDLVHWWILTCPPDLLAKVVLHQILESGETINARCRQSGTALHLLVNRCARKHYDRDCLLRKFILLARLGINPAIKHEGLTALQLAKKLKRAASIRSLMPFTRKPSDIGELVTIIQPLEYYEKNGRWPEPIVSRQAQHVLTPVHDELWQVEAGRIVMTDPAQSDIDAYKPSYTFRCYYEDSLMIE